MLSKTAPWHRTPEMLPRLTVTRLPTLDPAAWANAAAMASDLHAAYAQLLNGGAFAPSGLAGHRDQQHSRREATQARWTPKG
jgi:hypothetical protein